MSWRRDADTLAMFWDLFPITTLLAIAVGPFFLAYLGHALLGLALPVGYLLLVALIADDESPNYDMPGFGTKLLLVGCLIAATAWLGGLAAGQIRACLRRKN